MAAPDSPAAATRRASPAKNPGLVIRAFGDDTRQPVRYYLYKDVLEELVFASRYADENDICAAVLTGGFGVEGDRGFVEVTGFVGLTTITKPEGMVAAIRVTTDEYIRSGPQAVIVGLFVGQQGCGARLDPEAARVHFSLFNMPFQPLVVCDATSGQLSVAARGPRGGFFNAAFRAVGIREVDPALNAEPKPATTSRDDDDTEHGEA